MAVLFSSLKQKFHLERRVHTFPLNFPQGRGTMYRSGEERRGGVRQHVLKKSDQGWAAIWAVVAHNSKWPPNHGVLPKVG